VQIGLILPNLAQISSRLTSVQMSSPQTMSNKTSDAYDGALFDVQAHAIKPSSYEAIVSGIRKSPGLAKGTVDIIVDDICKKLADDLQGVDRLNSLGKQGVQVVTINTFFPSIPAQIMLNMVDDLNKWMSVKTAGNPQLIGTASIPSSPFLAKAGLAPDNESFTDKGVRGLRRAITEMGLKAVLFASNYDGIFLGDAAFEPYFAVVEELGIPIIIHPAIDPVEGDFIRRKNIPTYSGFLNDQRTTLLDLVMSGVFEKYPRITIIATHLGGGILTSLGRFKALSARFQDDPWYVDLSGKQCLLPLPIDHYLKKIYYDCNNAEVADIMHAASIVGVDHLLTGSDFPWTDDRFTREVLGQMDDSMRRKIAWENAAKLFGHATTT
jgi:predicted TIM-barrel fold metal-dependent hydrolase